MPTFYPGQKDYVQKLNELDQAALDAAPNAAAAEAARDAALVAQGAAETAQTGAETAQTGSEAARDQSEIYAAAAFGVVFKDTIALGRAAVADGANFGVKAGGSDGLTRASVYRRDTSSTQTLLYGVVPATEYDARIAVRNDRGGYLMTIEDSIAQIWIGFRAGGKIDIGQHQDVVATFTSLKAMLALQSGYDNVVNVVRTYSARGGVMWAVELGDGKMPVYVDTLGNTWIGRVNITALLGDSTLVTGMQGFFAPTLSLNIACYGDSITEGAGSSGGSGNYPYQLSQLYSGARSVANLGIGGQVSSQISIRAGGIATMVTVASNTIPAAVGAVTITCSTNPLTGTNPARSLDGWLRGVDGTLVAGVIDKALNSSALTFTRAVAGSDVLVDPDTPFLVDMSVYRDRILIIGAGTNDTKTTPEVTIANIQAVVDALPAIGPTGYKRWGWVNVWGGNAATTGTTAYTDVVAFNRALKAKWPNHCIDVRGALMRASDGSSNDNADIASGILPRSKSGDGIHLTDAGYAVYAATVKTYIDKQEATAWSPW